MGTQTASKSIKIGDSIREKDSGKVYTVEAVCYDPLTDIDTYMVKDYDETTLYPDRWLYPWEVIKVTMDPYRVYMEEPSMWGRKKCCDNPDIVKGTALFKEFYVCRNCKQETDERGFLI